MPCSLYCQADTYTRLLRKRARDTRTHKEYLFDFLTVQLLCLPDGQEVSSPTLPPVVENPPSVPVNEAGRQRCER